VVLVVAKEIKDLFSVSPIQLMSRCTRAGREHGQAANPSRAMEIFHTIDVMLSI